MAAAPTMAERIRRKLEAELAPQRLEITDDSERHRGHGGYREGGETHFRVEVVAERFRDMNRVARQREIYRILADELAERVHALQIAARTPEEDQG